jgi:hypothetical protein
MSRDTIPIQEWLASFQDAATEFARGSMRFDTRVAAAAAAASDDSARPGAYIAILSDQNSIHLGLSASTASLHALARGLLGLRLDEALSERDVVDGVSEVMNIVAGKVKSHMSGRDGQLRLGLPMYIPSPIAAGPGMEVLSAEIKIGPVPCKLSVYRRVREMKKAA